MEELHPEILQTVTDYLDDIQLANMCLTSKTFLHKVCNNTLWINKLANSFGLSREEMDENKKERTYWAYYIDLAGRVGNDDPQTLLRRAASTGDILLIKIALYRKADIRSNNNEALEEASLNNQGEAIKFLLSKGADLHSGDDVALALASQRGNNDAVEVLLRSGADVNSVDGRSLEQASQNGHVETVRLLLNGGANVHANGDAALLSAFQNNHREIVDILLASGADPAVLPQ